MAKKATSPEQQAEKEAAATEQGGQQPADTPETSTAPAEEPDAPGTPEGAEDEAAAQGEPEVSEDPGAPAPETPADSTAPEAPADSESETPPSPATSFSQTPEELKGRKEETGKARKASVKSAVLGAVATIADPESKEGKLLAKGRGILNVHSTEQVVYMTADGLGFFREMDACNHAAGKKDTTVLTVTRQ